MSTNEYECYGEDRSPFHRHHIDGSCPMADKVLAYVVNRLRREARRHLRDRTDYCRTRAAELRYQADVIEK